MSHIFSVGQVQLTKIGFLDRNFNPFKPSSLGEFNAALNGYYMGMKDLKVLAAVHKWFQSQIHHKEEENAIFKEVFNIE